MLEAFIPIIEQMTTVAEFIKPVPDLNHLDKVGKDLRSKNFMHFLRLT